MGVVGDVLNLCKKKNEKIFTSTKMQSGLSINQ